MASREPAGAELVRGFLDNSPFARHIGLRLVAVEADRAELAMPFAPELVTVGDVVHGGAISALADTAATAAAWATDDLPSNPRGSTASLAVSFVAAARASELRARAAVVRRGRSLCHCEVDVTSGDGITVARALAAYKLG